MIDQFKAICNRVKRNNGILQIFFTCHTNGGTQEQHAIFNIHSTLDKYKEGSSYKLTIEEEKEITD